MNIKKTILLSILLLIILLLGFQMIRATLKELEPSQYTTNIKDYGVYNGNYDNNSVREQINSFFPQKIEESFSDVTYSYRTKKLDAYAYEAYLEFVIEDEDEFLAFVKEHTGDTEGLIFEYDSSFIEHSLNRELWIDLYYDEETGENTPSQTYVDFAIIRSILYSDEENRIIFSSIGVYDGGGTTIDVLSVFFTRFGIDPKEYATKVAAYLPDSSQS